MFRQVLERARQRRFPARAYERIWPDFRNWRAIFTIFDRFEHPLTRERRRYWPVFVFGADLPTSIGMADFGSMPSDENN
jgi:hypothetical protein